MKYLFLIGVLTVISFSSTGQNKEIEINAEIKSVTIYTSSAEVNYQKEVLVPAGRSTIVFTDLTPFIVENTINISSSDPELDIITITEKINYTKERKAQSNLIGFIQDSIKHLETEIGLLRCKQESIKVEKELLTKNESIGGVNNGVLVLELEKAATFIGRRSYELSKELFLLTEKEERMAASLNKYNLQLNEQSIHSVTAGSEIKVTVISALSKKINFSFKFLTPKSGWAPVYDFKYLGPSIPLKLIFRADVYNATGTPWDNVDITLSTASPTTGFDTPGLNAESKTKGEHFEGGIKYKELEVINAIAEYPIKHKYSIPSDSKSYLVDVNTFSPTAEYTYLLIPKLDPFGFLIAKIPDWNKYNLIPGVANIYNKGSFMGKTMMNTYAANDTLNLYLGKDKNIQSVRKEITVVNNSTEKTSISISIKNSSSEILKIEMLDQVPVFPDNEHVKFNLQDNEKINYNKEEGLLSWKFSLSSNENKKIDFKYEIKYPKDDYLSNGRTKKKFRTISAPSF
jgi:hypothetical protein